MLARLLSPLPSERFPPPMPQCRALGGDGTYRKRIQPYFDALGWKATGLLREEFAGASAVGAILKSIETECSLLHEKLARDPGVSPVRILTKHYPRPDLPGRCITLHVTFFSVPDPWFDEGGLTPELLDKRMGQRISGQFVELRKTLQLQTDPPQIIEMELAASPKVIGAFHRESIAAQLQIPKLDDVDNDEFFGAHFQIYGGGQRVGIVSFDLAMGLGEPRMWSRAYSTTRRSDKREYDIELFEVEAEIVRALLDLVKKL